MKKARLLSLLLALCLLLALPVSALGNEDFEGGRLSGVCADGGALLVTDVYNKVVWRVSDGKAALFAGKIGAAGVSGEPVGAYHDGDADKAFFLEPWDIVAYKDGYAVTDAQANAVRYIEGGKVATLAGSGTAGKADGTGKGASFDHPTGLAVGNTGELYIADTGNGSIRCLAADGKVTTVVTGLSEPTGLCWYGGALYAVETGRSRIVRIADGAAHEFAGMFVAAEDEGESVGAYVDGPAASARFDHPLGIAVDADGTFYVSDAGNSAVRAIRDGRVYTLARGSAETLMPTTPRGLLANGNTLTVADRFAGSLLNVDLTPKTYADVASGAWYAAAVESATRNGIAEGTSETTFSPDASMNRAMFVTMLARMHRLTDGAVILDGDASFADVADDAWYAQTVRWAADNGVTKGEDGNFVPLRVISRQELVTMLYRYAQSQGMSALFSDSALEKFSDAADVAPWALDAMRWGCSHGILQGDGLGHVTPAAPATRAQALTMLLNFMNAYGI
ncbi:MAG: hypothetical protein E7474_06050 [Ruminococcaceae bacterium]|nr:hypothetical protein [Oscillospiraceae bacterium]